MDKMLYISMTGARETSMAQATAANNLANAKTTGFKADLLSFVQCLFMAMDMPVEFFPWLKGRVIILSQVVP